MTSQPNQHIDNGGANLGQQINVLGTANFGPITASQPSPSAAAAPAKSGGSIAGLVGLVALVTIGVVLYIVEPGSSPGPGSLQAGSPSALESPTTSAEIDGVLEDASPAIQACGAQNGVKSETRIPVVLVIAPGEVTAGVRGEFMGTLVEKCIIAELEQLQFPPLGNRKKKKTYTFTM